MIFELCYSQSMRLKKIFLIYFLVIWVLSCSGTSSTQHLSVQDNPALLNATKMLVHHINMDILQSRLETLKDKLTDPNWSTLTLGKTLTQSEITKIIDDLKILLVDIGDKQNTTSYLLSTPQKDSSINQHISKLIDDLYPVGGSWIYESIAFRKDPTVTKLLSYFTSPVDTPANSEMIINLLNLFNQTLHTPNANAQIKTTLGL